MMLEGRKACVGWWAQSGLGRQPMRNLHLLFEGATVTGSGEDIVAPFLFTGHLRAGGHVRLTKQYLPGHRVAYEGAYDGRNRLAGEWRLESLHGPWEIVILDEDEAEQADATAKELVVAGPPD